MFSNIDIESSVAVYVQIENQVLFAIASDARLYGATPGAVIALAKPKKRGK